MPTDTATQMPQPVIDRFNALIGACRRLHGCRVSVLIGDENSGFGLASFTGTVTDVRVEDNRVELTLDDGTTWVAMYAEMIDDVYADVDGIEIKYAAGNIEIQRLRL